MIRPGSMPHRLLSVACAVPLTARQLLERADTRYDPSTFVNPTTPTHACMAMARTGLLNLEKARGERQAKQFTITPDGEALLNQLHGQGGRL